MIEITVNVPDAPMWKRGAAARIASDEMAKEMHRAVQTVTGAIAPLIPVNTGMTRKALQNKVFGEAHSLMGRVFLPLQHAVPLEDGARWRGPSPPPGPLQLWVRRKLGISDEVEVRSVAFLVARALKRKGLKGRKFFERGWAQTEGIVRLRMDAMLARITHYLGGS